jgi:hypothetical protein
MHYQFTPIIMEKFTVTNADGPTTDFFPKSYTDAAVAAATSGPVATSLTDTSLVITHSDGSTQNFFSTVLHELHVQQWACVLLFSL